MLKKVPDFLLTLLLLSLLLLYNHVRKSNLWFREIQDLDKFLADMFEQPRNFIKTLADINLDKSVESSPKYVYNISKTTFSGS